MSVSKRERRRMGTIMIGVFIILAACSFKSLETSAAPPFGIIINEVLYDPYSPKAENEWVELWNSGTQAINIGNWSLLDQDGDDLGAGDVDLVFPDIDFPANAYILIHTSQGTNSTAFVDGKAEFYMWKSTSIWSPTGDDALLANETGATMDFMSYGRWNSTYVDDPPPDFVYEHSNATAEEGFSIALTGGEFRQSIPTPLEDNRDDVYEPILLTEVCYYPYGENEYVKVHNPLEYDVDISFWYISDGEGIVAFPSGTIIPSNHSYLIAQNSTNYIAETLITPDFEYEDLALAAEEMIVLGAEPQLRNDGDEVFLRNNYGTQIDAFVYGDSDYSGIGWSSGPATGLKHGRVAKRNAAAAYTDTNTSVDWENLREYGIAQSNFTVRTFSTDGKIEAFTSPDSSFNVISDAIDWADTSIAINLYEFTNTALADHLLAALGRGVEVSLFLEGAPVGGINVTELYIARQIVENGGHVRIMTNDEDNDIHQRYAYDHAKYLVLDNQSLMLMSENWRWTGVPLPGKWGNRGWGVRVDDGNLATHFAELFYTDWQPDMKDSVLFDSAHPKWNDGINYTYTGSNQTPIFDSLEVSSAAVITPVIAPDTALSGETVFGMLDRAQNRIYVEQFYIYKHWGDKDTGSTDTTPNVYLEAVIDAARRGCEVKVLLDASYYNVDETDPIDNDDTVEYVNSIALAEGLNMEAKLVNITEHDFSKIHNKGMIADDSVLISSINWNLNSVTKNREAGLIIQNQEVADYFTDVFDHDWTDDLTPPEAVFPLETTYQINEMIQFNASGSTDNVKVINYTWLLDGEIASYEMTWERPFTAEGNHTIELKVGDFWENSDGLTKEFSVVPLDQNNNGGANETDNNNNTSTGGDDSTALIIGLVLLAPIAVFIGLLYIIRAKKR